MLTVQLYLTQSSQKREAENFFLMTTVMPCIIHWPTPTMLPGDKETGAVSQTYIITIIMTFICIAAFVQEMQLKVRYNKMITSTKCFI